MDKRLKELIDERIFGIKREREIDKKVREWVNYYKRKDKFEKQYSSWGSRFRRLLVGDDGLGWSWRVWFSGLFEGWFGKKW
ncbi:MAG: hypothetical protein ACE5PV_03030 [Candidatus Poribacteria bacterium]